MTPQEAAGQGQTSLSGLQRHVGVHPLCSALQQGLWPVLGRGSCQFIMIATLTLALRNHKSVLCQSNSGHSSQNIKHAKYQTVTEQPKEGLGTYC